MVVGLATAAIAGWHFTRDTQFAEVLAAYERHPEHALFQADYWIAAARHYGMLALAIVGLCFGLAAGPALLGLTRVRPTAAPPWTSNSTARWPPRAPNSPMTPP